MPNRVLRDGILSSERIAQLSWAEEVFYRRLHSVVDDYGRFHAHTSLLLAACYPLQLKKVSDSDIGKWLLATEKAGLVRVYPASDGKRYLEVLDFGQRIQSKSKYPDPVSGCSDFTVNHCYPRKLTVSNGDPPSSTALVGVEDEDEKQGSAPPGGEAPDRIPYQAIVDAYNGTMTGLARVRELTPKRRTLIRSAWQASAQRRSLGFWQAYFAECNDDPFNNGTGPYKAPHENWRPTFDYLLRADVVTRIFEAALDRMERGG